MGFSSASKSVKFNLNQLKSRAHLDYKDVYGNKSMRGKTELNFTQSSPAAMAKVEKVISKNRRVARFWNLVSIVLPIALGLLLFYLVYTL
ncbi:hypothetical protein [Croceivirga sp. JEA036]|uniref:hypothetical protein n=1 Tax=Croceivirga sp. JEA036 TaxID=2721162 RepID=UPI00143BD4E4|nr:hypothetical protein [Croceivirga sp. JEA036]NJB35527.1 hypothetical protein [Croceivirga sp. JEA036]